MATDKRVKITKIFFRGNDKRTEEAAKIVALSILKNAMQTSKIKTV